MRKFDMTIYGRRGSSKHANMNKFPTQEEIEGYISAFERVGEGEVTRIIIDNIR